MLIEFYDLVNDEKNKHLVETIVNLVQNEVLVIINHNDALCESELKNISNKSDNDKNTIYITEVINRYCSKYNFIVNKVIYLTNTFWLLDENKNTVLWWEISLINIDLEKEKYLGYVETNKSDAWIGWMWSKVNCAFEVLKFWAKQSIISSAKTWLDCLKNDYDKSTRFYIKE